MTNITKPHKSHENPQHHVREQPLARTHTACTKLHGPLQSSPAPIPGMQRPPRARIALNGGHSPPEAAQGVEARRHEKRCHEASDTISCTRGRWQASQTSARRQAGHCRAHGKVVQLTCAPHGGQPARRLTVEDVALVLSPAVSATPRPSAAGSRRLRRCAALLTRSVSSSRLTPTTPCRRLRFIEICGTSQVFGMIVLQEDYGTSRVNMGSS
jgi:hypothetical protein